MVPKPVYNPNNYKHLSQEHQDNYRKAAEYPHIFYFQATKTFVAFRLKPNGQWLPVSANKNIEAADKKYQGRLRRGMDGSSLTLVPEKRKSLHEFEMSSAPVEQREQGRQDMTELPLGMERFFKKNIDLSFTTQQKD